MILNAVLLIFIFNYLVILWIVVIVTVSFLIFILNFIDLILTILIRFLHIFA